MYKHSRGLLPSVFDDVFVKHSDIHGFNTRHKNCLRLPQTKKVFCEQSIRFTGTRLWNNINDTIKGSKNIKQFRNAYKNYLMQNYI